MPRSFDMKSILLKFLSIENLMDSFEANVYWETCKYPNVITSDKQHFCYILTLKIAVAIAKLWCFGTVNPPQETTDLGFDRRSQAKN